MTVIRTDIIPNLYANPIQTVSTAATAVMTVPVTARVVSTTGTIGTVTGSGTSSVPWTATITLMSAVTGLESGQVITATAGTGTFAAGGVVHVKSVVGNKSIQINKIGGTIPTAGTVTNISRPADTTFPIGVADGDPILITNLNNTFTFTTTGEFVGSEIITQEPANDSTPGATGEVINCVPAISGASITGSVEYRPLTGIFNTSFPVTGSLSNFTATPTTVTGMNELLTAGENNTNKFFVKRLTSTTYELYEDTALTVGVDSSTFNTYTTNAGQYTTFDQVQITEPTP
jgi:hypothetical protein